MVFCGVLYPVLGGRVLKDISVFTRIDHKGHELPTFCLNDGVSLIVTFSSQATQNSVFVVFVIKTGSDHKQRNERNTTSELV